MCLCLLWPLQQPSADTQSVTREPCGRTRSSVPPLAQNLTLCCGDSVVCACERERERERERESDAAGTGDLPSAATPHVCLRCRQAAFLRGHTYLSAAALSLSLCLSRPFVSLSFSLSLLLSVVFPSHLLFRLRSSSFSLSSLSLSRLLSSSLSAFLLVSLSFFRFSLSSSLSFSPSSLSLSLAGPVHAAGGEERVSGGRRGRPLPLVPGELQRPL